MLFKNEKYSSNLPQHKRSFYNSASLDTKTSAASISTVPFMRKAEVSDSYGDPRASLAHKGIF